MCALPAAGAMTPRTSDDTGATWWPPLIDTRAAGGVSSPVPHDAAIALAAVKDEPFGWRCAPSLHCRCARWPLCSVVGAEVSLRRGPTKVRTASCRRRRLWPALSLCRASHGVRAHIGLVAPLARTG